MNFKKIANFLNRNLSSRIWIKRPFVARPKTCERHFKKISNRAQIRPIWAVAIIRDPQTARSRDKFQNLFTLGMVKDSQDFLNPGPIGIGPEIPGYDMPLKSLLNWVPNQQSFVRHFYSSHLVLMDRSYLLTILFDVFPEDCNKEHIHTSNHLKNYSVLQCSKDGYGPYHTVVCQAIGSKQRSVHNPFWHDPVLSSFGKLLRTV